MRKKIFKLVGRILLAVLALGLAVFIGLELFIHFYNPVTTTLAQTYRHEQLLTVNGMILREEQYVTYNGDGVIDYPVADGEKVSLGDGVALSYADADQAAAGRKKVELEEEIDNIRSVSSVNDYYVLDLDRIKEQITESLYRISSAKGEDGVADVGTAVEELRSSVTKKQAATGVKLDFSVKLEELQQQVDTLAKRITEPPETVKAPAPGYFFSSCDGYENVVDMTRITGMTAEDYRAILPKEVPENAVGKLALSYEWYYVFTADRATAQTFSEGGKVEMRFPNTGAESFPATVAKVNYTGEEALVILRCQYMSTQYAVSRDQTLQVVTKRYDGLYVEDDAIRVVDGQMGVYVLVGVEVKFRTIDVLYSSEEFSVVTASDAGSGGLQLYDYIITKGNGLYDGKLIYRQAT